MGDHIHALADLQQRHALTHTQHFSYLQLRHAVLVHLPSPISLPEFSPLEAQVMMGNLGKGGVSRIYRSLINNGPASLDGVRARWEGWVGPLEEADCRDALMAPRTLTTSSRLRLVQIYYLHTVYLTPARPFRAHLRPSPDCPKCGSSPADFYHMVWLCPALERFWRGWSGSLH